MSTKSYIYFDKRSGMFRSFSRRSSRAGLIPITYDALCAGLQGNTADAPDYIGYRIGDYVSVVDGLVITWSYLPYVLTDYIDCPTVRIWQGGGDYTDSLLLPVADDLPLRSAVERVSGMTWDDMQDCFFRWLTDGGY